jgi:hypothetical protein
MALGLFNTFTPEEVETIRTKAVSLVMAGQVVFSWSSEGTSASKGFTLPMTTVLDELNYWYQVHQPEVYGKRVTRTTPCYSK